ncbi:MAG: DNA repair exonuclease [Candidatus Diapherotrites archaeon]|nr:DNA repair exonuclease [Candidatus Diapherotrites archaeon]
MKIAVISDTHFGYGWGTERENDSFEQAEEAIKKAIELKADIILMPGDIFDSRIPRQEVMEKAMRTLSIALHSNPTNVKVDTFSRDISPRTFSGVPIIAIHGTHERRGKGLVNPVKELEAANFLVALHCERIVLSKDGEKIAIHGMGGVPESYALDVLKQWNPKPLPNMFNILVLHQSFKEYIYEEAAFLSLDDMPSGFDLIINGHIHWHDILEKNGKKLLLPGSTITTQIRKGEAEKPKGFCMLDTATNNIEFFPLSSQRKVLYIDLSFEGEDASTATRKIKEKISSVLNTQFNKKPLLRVKISGTIKTGATIDRKEILDSFKDKAIISFDDVTTVTDFKRKIGLLREMQKSKMSVDEMGIAILRKNLEEAGYQGPDASKLLSLLAEGDIEKAIEFIYKNAPS